MAAAETTATAAQALSTAAAAAEGERAAAPSPAPQAAGGATAHGSQPLSQAPGQVQQTGGYSLRAAPKRRHDFFEAEYEAFGSPPPKRGPAALAFAAPESTPAGSAATPAALATAPGAVKSEPTGRQHAAAAVAAGAAGERAAAPPAPSGRLGRRASRPSAARLLQQQSEFSSDDEVDVGAVEDDEDDDSYLPFKSGMLVAAGGQAGAGPARRRRTHTRLSCVFVCLSLPTGAAPGECHGRLACTLEHGRLLYAAPYMRLDAPLPRPLQLLNRVSSPLALPLQGRTPRPSAPRAVCSAAARPPTRGACRWTRIS